MGLEQISVWNGLKWHSIGLVASSCEQGNELSDYDKKGNL
jgi:hypothetical protein